MGRSEGLDAGESWNAASCDRRSSRAKTTSQVKEVRTTADH
jgi:hypothetical protein